MWTLLIASRAVGLALVWRAVVVLWIVCEWKWLRWLLVNIEGWLVVMVGLLIVEWLWRELDRWLIWKVVMIIWDGGGVIDGIYVVAVVIVGVGVMIVGVGLMIVGVVELVGGIVDGVVILLIEVVIVGVC